MERGGVNADFAWKIRRVLLTNENPSLRNVGESLPLRLYERLGYTIVQDYTDSGSSGGKSRNDRPALDAITKDATRRGFDMVMYWSIERLGRLILMYPPKS